MSLWEMEHFVLMFLVAVVSSHSLQLECAPGSYVLTPRIGPDICHWCTEGVNFIPRYPGFWHSYRSCFNCTQVRDENLEVLVSPCNRTQDAEILCREGYYRRKARNVREKDTCVKCSDCEHVTQPCQGYYDALCCQPSYEAVWNKHGFYECRERPILCGAGEFLSLKTEQCTPCPPGTFMAIHKHNFTNCQLCQTLDDVALNNEIIQSCNRTHSTIFTCKDGYFKLVSEKPNETIELCEPCMKCSNQKHEVRKCDRLHDTVCCDSAEMRVQDTEHGPRCLYKNEVVDYSIITADKKITTEQNQSYKVNPENNPLITLTTSQTTYLPYRPMSIDNAMGQEQGFKMAFIITAAIFSLYMIAIIGCFIFKRKRLMIFQSKPDHRLKETSKRAVSETDFIDLKVPLM